MRRSLLVGSVRGLATTRRPMKKMAVIGAGITGVTTARALMERGFDVTVFDRHRYAAMETSFANGGQLSASNAEVWNSTGTILKGIKWMFQKDAPLLMNPLADISWHKYSWMAEFMSQIPNYRSNTIDTVKLAIAARELLLKHAKTYGFDFNPEHRGILHFYSDQKEFEHAAKVNELYAEGGLERDLVTNKQIGEIEPALAGGNYLGGYFTPSDFTGDIHRYTVGLAEGIEKEGVKFRMGNAVESIEHHGKRMTGPKGYGYGVAVRLDNYESESFDGVVICAGVLSRGIASSLGDRVNIYPVKGYSITVNLNDEKSQNAAPWVSLLDDKAKIVTSRLGIDRFRIAGTAEFNGYNRDIRNDRIEPLIRWCNTHFPDINTKEVVPWAGLRPMMPTMLPRVGAGKKPGVFYNTGHGHLGWTLSAATAEMVGDAVAQVAENGYTGPMYTFAVNENIWSGHRLSVGTA
uniref:FAD dependent oxidoreductase domain-containing protein n=1 Tax=Haptolina brevifila TaxID=156173 RepID=A0A7S2GCG1_9EUKA|mmetsp:Transcript_33737/g.67220  ORF Transcript_33737/g.67220 Transcript_33737/m.67220 type:complete len:463 (+) Transcript_33737:85-1473(+)|eukprot:CAMPEP_0174716356 /NCGR_PEP_ID=MMETSP1094-20130205/23832_1 /TAXON_ID=156173 /ORGANISM="Chrysochromulina brevifilum, Strain UTEX LB 985" /LENGTH=462 /DNA_ID=CAMNT_0015916081 /DNA_START=83 /DNA_END=1471 /DNA_ORIENTATION=+